MLVAEQSSNQPGQNSSTNSDSGVSSSTAGQQIDATELFNQIASQNQQLEQNKQELSTANKRSGEALSTLERLKAALGGEDKKGPTDDELDEQHLDFILSEMLEAEKRGIKMPITSSIAPKLIETRKQMRKTAEAQNAAIAALTKQVETLTNPQARTDQATYSSMDNMLQGMVEQVYGGANPGQHHAIATAINQEINRLQKDDPESWAKVKRSPNFQKSMVNHFVQQAIPPRAREILHNEQIKNEPITTDEILSAIEEARNTITDPAKMAATVQTLREAYWEAKYLQPGKRR